MQHPSVYPSSRRFAVGYPINNVFQLSLLVLLRFLRQLCACRCATVCTVSCRVDLDLDLDLALAEAPMCLELLSLRWMSLLRPSSSTLQAGTHIQAGRP